MRRALIIGYGNPLRGDDGLGRYAARRLRERISLPELQVIESHQLTPEMAEPISESEVTVFIDADQSTAPGEVRLCRLDPAPAETPSLTHHVSPRSLLSLAEILYGNRPEAYLLSAGAAAFAFEEALSPIADAALEKVVECACHLVRTGGNNEVSYGHK